MITNFRGIFGEFDIPTWLRNASFTDDIIPKDYCTTDNYREYVYACLISSSYYSLKFKFDTISEYKEFIEVILETLEKIPISGYSFPGATVFGMVLEYSVNYEELIDERDHTAMERILKLLISFQRSPYISMLDPNQVSSYLIFVIRTYNLSKQHIEMLWYILNSDDMLHFHRLSSNLICKHATSEKILNRMKLTGTLNLSPEEFLIGK